MLVVTTSASQTGRHALRPSAIEAHGACTKERSHSPRSFPSFAFFSFFPPFFFLSFLLLLSRAHLPALRVNLFLSFFFFFFFLYGESFYFEWKFRIFLSFLDIRCIYRVERLIVSLN